MLAIVAAVLFLVALIFELGSLVFGPLGALVFITAGLLCLALQLPGVGRRTLLRRDRPYSPSQPWPDPLSQDPVIRIGVLSSGVSRH